MPFKRINLLAICLFFLSIFLLVNMTNNLAQNSTVLVDSLLTDPFLQLPTKDSVRVVWFTDFAGSEHQVLVGDKFERAIVANTTQLTRIREDRDSYISQPPQTITQRKIWRHEAIVNSLIPGQFIPYKVISIPENSDRKIESKIFKLTAKPKPGQPLKILLTSDHQLMPMVAANLQKVAETIGTVDAVFFAGDLVNIPDRASEWFDDRRGGSFFACLQGRGNYQLEKTGIKTVYRGGELIQNAPLFPTIGNHEVMGRWNMQNSLKEQFADPIPRHKAQQFYQQINLEKEQKHDQNIAKDWLKNNSFNVDTYEEIFTLPESTTGGKKYYAVTFGDIRLVVLYATSIWRSPDLNPDLKGRYQEKQSDLDRPEQWGYGQHIFEPIKRGSTQYNWLEQELNSQEFRSAKYKIVMLHHPPHTLGGNIVPPFTDPIARIDTTSEGKIRSVYYEYPQENDYLIRDLIPLLEAAKVQLVFYGHSHLWNRFISQNGMHFLESSNVGNSYGAHVGNNKRPVPTDQSKLNYVEVGDPNGLEPILPTIAPLIDETGKPLPYIASNDLTTFSILDTNDSTISSYYFDTLHPNSAVVKFDEFRIK